LFFKNFIEKYQVIERQELTCFHSKVKYHDTNMLGFGLNLTRYPKSVELQEVQCFLDPISWYSFESLGIKKSVW
jgi:hypothetical protein